MLLLRAVSELERTCTGVGARRRRRQQRWHGQGEEVKEVEEVEGMEDEGQYRLHRLLVGCDFCCGCQAIAGLHKPPQELILQCGAL